MWLPQVNSFSDFLIVSKRVKDLSSYMPFLWDTF